MPGPGDNRNSEGDMIQLDDGRMLLAYSHFVGSSSDSTPAFIAGRYSNDGGLTWSEDDIVLVPNTADQNVMSVSLLRMENHDIGMFYLQKNSIEDCRPVLRTTSDEGITWSDPLECISDEDIGYFVLNNDRVVRLDSGRLVMPVALHNRPDWTEPDWQGELMCYLSDDDGKTWQKSQDALMGYSPTGSRVTTQEPGVIQLNDGSLMMFCRTDAGCQYASFSYDDGNTWVPLGQTNIISPKSPASIERIPSTGELLMVWNDHSMIPPELQGKRTPLCVGISDDEGRTWHKVLTLEDAADGRYCYTSIGFVDDRVLLSYMANDSSTGPVYALKNKSVPMSMLRIPTYDPPGERLDSNDFRWKYEMDVDICNPTAVNLDGNTDNGGQPLADWNRTSTGDIIYADGIMTIGNGGSFIDSGITTDTALFPNVGFTCSDGFTVEISMRVAEETIGKRACGIAFAPTDSDEVFILNVFSDSLVPYYDSTPLLEADNTDAFHKIRIVRSANADGGLWWVWRDGILITPNGLSDSFTYERDAIYLGDIGSAYEGVVEVDYIRLAHDSYAPVPEPDIWVLLIGSLLLPFITRWK